MAVLPSSSCERRSRTPALLLMIAIATVMTLSQISPYHWRHMKHLKETTYLERVISVVGSSVATTATTATSNMNATATALPQTKTLATATTTTRTDGKATVREVDCRTFRAENDPNHDMEEDPKRLVNLARDDNKNVIPTPEFWIALFSKQFDRVRWKSIMDKGVYYEVGITRIFQDILQPSQPKGLVLDVGMNIGWFTILSRAMGHTVMSFDPNGIMHQRVCNSLALNGWWNKIRGDESATSSERSGVSTFLYGLGDTVGSLEFSAANNPGAGSFVRDRWRNTTRSRQWRVPVTTLDTLAREQGWLGPPSSSSSGSSSSRSPPTPIIHLLKVDVEAYEAFVFRGGSELIRSGLIRNILHENGHGNDEELALREVLEVFGNLAEAGYKIHAITNTGGVVTPRYQRMVGPVNLGLRDGTFAGSDMHEHLAKTDANIWWKKLENSK